MSDPNNDRLPRIPSSAGELSGHLRKFEGATLRHAQKFLVRRWQNLREVREHTFGWLLFVGVLIAAMLWQTAHLQAQYEVPVPAEGLVYTEGVVGNLDNINPLYASSPAERAATRLLFAQLLTYNDKNQLVGDLASKWSVDSSGKIYTIWLRQNAKWHDNVPITAKDVQFTFDLIKNADTKSPLYSSWRNIKVEQLDAYTVQFTLPAVYAPFPNALVQGIVPEHTLRSVRPSELRNSNYNRSPAVGSGPFAFQDLALVDPKANHSLLRMTANKTYFKGKPKLGRFHLHAYADSEHLTRAFKSHEVAAIADTTGRQAELAKDNHANVSNTPLLNAVYAFLKNDSPILSDQRVRQALELATDQATVLKQVESQQKLGGPLLPGQLGYTDGIWQAPTNIEIANHLLDEAGWPKGANGKRQKDGQPLQLQVASLSTGDYPALVELLMDQWSRLGIDFNSQLVSPESIQQNVIVPRTYDILVYELAVGHDPDVYAYWHSSQANARGFNLSDYRSARADDALDSARSRLEPDLRAAKYRTFMQAWVSDVPAIALYQSSLTYVSNKNTTNFASSTLAESSDRYYNVRYWAAGQMAGRPTR